MPHVTEMKVRFADLDPYDHVNHARYLTYFESARIELLDEVGFGMDVMKEAGFQIVLVEITARFHRAASLHDVLAITTTLKEVRRATATWYQEARSDAEVVADLEVRAAFTDLDGKPRRPPQGFTEAVAQLS